MGEEMSEDQKIQDTLFEQTMKKNWNEVEKIYKEHPFVHKTKLSKSGDTSFHIAISHSKGLHDDGYVCQMMEVMKTTGSLHDVLSMQNTRGDTALHLAAAVGAADVCERIGEINRELIRVRNARGETPLFVAANHGKLEAFLCLHQLFNDDSDESLCRRKDGNTILHVAIFGDYFALAYQISLHYPQLVNSLNADGEFPLHVLAKKPDVFKSCKQYGFFDSIIYHCVFVDEIKEQRYNQRATQYGYSQGRGINYPENYATCVNIFFLFWTPIYESCAAGFRRSREGNSGSIDEENHKPKEHEPRSSNAGFRRSKEGNSDTTDEENQQHKPKEHEESKVKRENHASVPPNYTTCVLLFKFVVKVILIVAGVGYWKFKKIRDKKTRNSHAEQIMNRLIELEPSYRYNNHGHRPFQKLDFEGIKLPDEPPPADDEHENEKDHNNSGKLISGKKETPLLVAAKMGILEIVKKIVTKYHVAIEDEDEDGKNALMIAAEHRQISVFNYLWKKDFPECVFIHVDDRGNSILHLAAMLGEMHPWQIPGAALQMQWEIKWYEYVKRSIPSVSLAHHNTKGETPRKIFTRTHENLVKEGNGWLIKTSESCSVVAALIATVAFATSATVPGGLNESSGHPVLKDEEAFDVFSISSLVALCLSVTALIFVLAIITSRFEERDFKTNLPRKLLMGLTCLFSSIVAMLLSFCAGHTFILREKLRLAAVPIYAVAVVPISFFAIAQLPLYFDLLRAACRNVPLRSYKQFHN